ncbi:MAG TPA: DMT family transporter [Caldimonas sp.]|nr:DMT family transporter [Caldimonas sp.]
MNATTARAAPTRDSVRAALALVANAAVWGTCWWPFRQLEARGIHPLWATAITFGMAAAGIALARPRAVAQLVRTPVLWVLVAAAGTTNATFNWAVVIGDVVRVVLLFYLMPVWTVLLARLVLGERLDRRAALRTLLGLAGAATVLWPARGHDAMAPALADMLGIAGGMSFALNNVMLRREAARPEEGRALAMFLGGALVAGALAAALGASGAVPTPRIDSVASAVLTLALALVFLGGNLALQYGAARLPANRTAVIMLSEVVFASVSAAVVGGETPGPRLLVGGACIVAGALLAATSPGPRRGAA